MYVSTCIFEMAVTYMTTFKYSWPLLFDYWLCRYSGTMLFIIIITDLNSHNIVYTYSTPSYVRHYIHRHMYIHIFLKWTYVPVRVVSPLPANISQYSAVLVGLISHVIITE